MRYVTATEVSHGSYSKEFFLPTGQIYTWQTFLGANVLKRPFYHKIKVETDSVKGFAQVS